MDKDQIFARVQKIVSNQLGIENSQVQLDAEFTKDLGADSLDTGVTRSAQRVDFKVTIDYL